MFQKSVITQEMRDLIGVESAPMTHDVEKGAVVKFAEAIGDPNPLFNDEEAARKTRYGGLIAPPTFLRSMRSGPLDVDVPSPYSAILDAGSEWEHFQPVRVGDRITVTTTILSIFERQGRLGEMVFIVMETKYVNQLGVVVAIQKGTGIRYKPPKNR